MNRLIYRFAVLVLEALGKTISIFGTKARPFFTGRRQLASQYASFGAEPHPNGTVWIHCASLGEFEQGRPLLEELRRRSPQLRILLTFFSPSGYEVRKNYPLADAVLYLPVDTPANARLVIDAVNPSLVIFVKYDFWPILLLELARRNVPVLAVSSIFRPDQIYFRWYGSFFLAALRTLRHVFVQDDRSAELLKEVGMDRVTRAGDTRFDRVAALAGQAPRLDRMESFLGDHPCWVIGSAWIQDVKVLAPLIRALAGKWRFVIVPHEVDEPTLRAMESELGVETLRWSGWSTGAAESTATSVMLVDTIGILSLAYRYARYAWVGGAFGKGLHNILEAAVYGVPVFFGNRNHRKFREAALLLEAGGAFAVGDHAALAGMFEVLEQDPERYRRAAEASAILVRQHRGATDMIVDHIFRHKLL